MNNTTSRSLKVLGVTLALLVAAGPLALADTAVWSTNLVGPMAGGASVQVGVSNVGRSPATGVVSVQAVVGGVVVTGCAPVSLMPGQSTVVVVVFSSPVQGVLDVAMLASSMTSPTMMGVIDESTPF